MTFLLIFSRSGEASLEARTILRCTQDTSPLSQELQRVTAERLLLVASKTRTYQVLRDTGTAN
jgi:hypothetical protein